MSVAEDDHVRLAANNPFQQSRRSARPLNDVMDQATAAMELHHLGLSEAGLKIVVPEYSGDWGDGVQLVNNVRSTEVSCMEDMLDSRKVLRDAGIEVTVGIRNKAKGYQEEGLFGGLSDCEAGA